MPSESTIICAAQGMAGLDIAEYRRPQGSQAQTRAGDKQADTRVSSRAGRGPDRPGQVLGALDAARQPRALQGACGVLLLGSTVSCPPEV